MAQSYFNIPMQRNIITRAPSWCRRPLQQRRLYARALAASAVTASQEALAAKVNKWQTADSEIGDVLATINWSDIRSAPGMHARDAELWHRIQLCQLRTWNPVTNTMECPRRRCTQPDNGDTAHIVWHCTRARDLWERVARLWRAIPGTAAEHKTAIFSWEPPPSALDWRPPLRTLRQEFPSAHDLHNRLRHWLYVAWRQLVTCVIRHLWTRRVAETQQPTDDPECADYPRVLQAWRDKMYGTNDAISLGRTETRSVDLRVQQLLCGTSLTEVIATVIHAVPPTTRFLLFFDGGSHGNPGPGGSGSVIVTFDSEHNNPEVLWAASMSYAAATTTNNQAEYQGLITGLRAAADNRWHLLAVIGDSHMIIRQLSRRRPPKKPHLAQAYAIARRHADSMVITGGTITIANTTRWLTKLQTSRWTYVPASKSLLHTQDRSSMLSECTSTATSHIGSTEAHIPPSASALEI